MDKQKGPRRRRSENEGGILELVLSSNVLTTLASTLGNVNDEVILQSYLKRLHREIDDLRNGHKTSKAWVRAINSLSDQQKYSVQRLGLHPELGKDD